MADQLSTAVNGITNTIYNRIYRWGGRLSQQALESLARDLTQTLIDRGGQHIEETIQQFVNNHQELREQSFQVINGIVNNVQQVWTDNQNDWYNVIRAVRETAGDLQSFFNMEPEQRDQAAFGWMNPANPEDPGQLIREADDLISENHEELTRAQQREFTRARDRARMDSRNGNDDPMEGEQVAARSASGGMGGVSKETPISNYPSLSYGLQETHTTILPYRTYMSVALLDHTAPAQLKIRMNSVWDMIDVDLKTLAAGGTPGTKDFYILPLSSAGSGASSATFPAVGAAGTNATERPQWRDYWVQLYEYYTVLGCKYKITIINPSTTVGEDIEVATQIDTYSDTATSTGNVMPLTDYIETKAFKNIQWQVVPVTNSVNMGKHIAIISGTYKPGQAKRNIVNDGDVKTWTKTDGTLPNLKETLTVNFFKAALANGAKAHANIAVELDYIVQFKDLKKQARYPNSLDNTGVVYQGITNLAVAANPGEVADQVRITQ